MAVRRFDWLLRTRGPVLGTWPASERDAALRLLKRSSGARRLLADALSGEDAPELDAAGLLRMQGVVRRALTPPPPVLRGIRWGAVCACMAAGLYLGLPRAEPDQVLFATVEPGPTVQAGAADTVLAALDE